MEGNIVFRQGERVIYARQMYYDATNQVATVLGAEMLTPVPRFEGLLRFRAEVVRQIGHDQFEANDAFFTSSRLGVARLSPSGGQRPLRGHPGAAGRSRDRPADPRPADAGARG